MKTKVNKEVKVESKINKLEVLQAVCRAVLFAIFTWYGISIMQDVHDFFNKKEHYDALKFKECLDDDSLRSYGWVPAQQAYVDMCKDKARIQ